MTTKIEELGGLPKGEIHLAIAQSEEKIGAILEKKLKYAATSLNNEAGTNFRLHILATIPSIF